MKNLDIKVLNAINTIMIIDPTVIFGGSLVLNLYGLIDRPIGDIDIIGLNPGKFVKNEFDITSSDINTNADKDLFKRKMVGKINGMKFCYFTPIDSQAISFTKFKLNHGTEHNGVTVSITGTINVQSINTILEAKMAYNRPKDIEDVEKIKLVLNEIF